MKFDHHRVLTLISLFAISLASPLYAIETVIDTTRIDLAEVQVTAIKQGSDLKLAPVSASVVSASVIERSRVSGLKQLSLFAPNFYMPDYGSRTTSSIYVRGLGTRIDNPVLGLNVDNVPILNKDNYDLELVDVSRIELLRGPQSALYGRGTMGGVINLYTTSPFSYQGFKAGVEYGSGNSMKSKLSYFDTTPSGEWAYAATAYYNQCDGVFTNSYTQELVDWEQLAGGRLRLQYRSPQEVKVDQSLSLSHLKQGGYAYQPLETEQIAYNDPCSFDRDNLTYGITLDKPLAQGYHLNTITSYHYTDNDLLLDNDFTPASYFTLNQLTKEHTVTQDIIFRSPRHTDSGYSWLVGAFGFYEHTQLDAPVLFKEYGIEQLILKNANANDPEYTFEWLEPTLLLESNFVLPTVGASLYHNSTLTLDRWRFTAEVRLELEHTTLNYRNYTSTSYRATKKENPNNTPPLDLPVVIDNSDRLSQTFFECLPKVAVTYSLAERGALYASIAKGSKSGGFNTQMFSDVLQQQLMQELGVGTEYEVEEIITYRPEYSWNYELGGNLDWRAQGLFTNFALFYIDCRDQQLTRFPEGSTTGRLMTNAGRTRSLGAEAAIRATLLEHRLNLHGSYGYTNAKFVDYDNGKEQYAGKFVPYAPQHTLSLRGDYTQPIAQEQGWIEAVTLSAGVQGVGDIYWEEDNLLRQPLYFLCDASLSLRMRYATLSVWGKNLANANYHTFFFRSIGNAFVQQGMPRTVGVSCQIAID